MTIIEVDQAIRNLIVSQPMITTGPMGSVVSSVMSILDSYRNFNLAVQSYPMQDSLKFNLMAETQRMENSICMSITQALQERGINIMSFMMQGQYPQNRNNGMLSSLIFNQPNGQPNYGTNPVGNAGFIQPNGYGMGGRSQGAGFGPQPPYGMGGRPVPPPMPPMGGQQMGGYGNAYPPKPPMGGRPQMPPKPGYPRTPAPAKPINVEDTEPAKNNKVVTPEPQKEVEIPAPVVQPSKHSMKTQTSAKPVVAKSEPKQPAIMFEPEPDFDDDDNSEPTQPSSSAGRDYLLQLLKK